MNKPLLLQLEFLLGCL